MPDTKKYLDIEGLTEYHESAGHSADIADGSITTSKLATSAVTSTKIADAAVTTNRLENYAVTSFKLANGAVTNNKLANDAVTLDKINGNAVRAMHDISLIAADSQADQALTALHMNHRTLTPAQMLENNEYTNSANRLCWVKGSYMEVAAISFFGDLQSGQITLYAHGMDSGASGKLGIDTSWAIV